MEQQSGVRPRRGMIWLTTGALLGLAVVFGLMGSHSSHPAPSMTFASPSGAGRLAERLPPTRRLLDKWEGSKALGGTRSEPLLRPGDDRDYATLSARLAPLAGKDNIVATLLMREALAACRHPLDPGWRIRMTKPRAIAYATWKEGFCNRAVSEAEQDAIDKQGREAFVRRHPEWQTAGPQSTDEVLDAVLSSDDVEVMDMASIFLRWSGPNRWGVGKDLVEGAAYQEDLHKYQRVAIQDMQCAETGGCGSGGMRSAMICLMSDGLECSPGQGAYDMWNDQLSPQEIDVVLAIEQRILDERARRIAAPPN
jgi:hypothetical protein